ncbi:insulin-degrading enzyme-like [Dendronephthya gigantea]|uniref:insulin-degrading enzyme-like n=1 Tax=Dendronephthya gigantea TaxID=151771 RepID=UPI00106A1490|nr:insulin-degrading enzyme-like [Dendronephthya gigantea]
MTVEDKASGFKVICDDILKSEGDDRLYRGLVLKNEMKILVVSDPKTEKAAASMDVHIGSLSDPDDIPGLAHFCEHMAFLGTKKFPEENKFTQFLSENSGSSNAFTSNEHTNFYFDVKQDCLEGALEIFAEFFISPLFDENAKDREVNAVNSENDKNLKHDSWRLEQLNRSTVDPSHPFKKFGTGNKTTLETRPRELGIDVQKALLEFHEKYYSANMMSLTVIGQESLNELMDLVFRLFNPVINCNVNIPIFEYHPYKKDQLQVRFEVVPVMDTRKLRLVFPFPDITSRYRAKPDQYLSHLIGHEADGSLLSFIKEQGWGNTLGAGTMEGAKGFMFFICNIELTESGLDHVDDIIASFFQYVKMLREVGPKDWIFQEVQALATMHFRFKDKEKPVQLVTRVSKYLHQFDMKDVLSGAYLLSEIDKETVTELLALLVPEKIRVFVMAKKFEKTADEIEEWYGTKYSVKKIPNDAIEKWCNVELNESFRLPKPNEFIATNFDIKPRNVEGKDVPEIIKNCPFMKVWFKQDDTFFVPKSCAYFQITSPLAYRDPMHCNMNRLFVMLLKDSLTEYAYDAELAGMEYRLDVSIYGINLSVSGYNDKQDTFMLKILQRMTSFEVDSQRFEILKEKSERSLRNFRAQQPHHHAVYYTSYILEELAWSNDEMLDAIADINEEVFKKFIVELLKRVHIEVLLHGNLTKEEALDIASKVENVFKQNSSSRPLLPSQLTKHREVQLPDGSNLLYEVENEVHKSCCLEIYYQCELQALEGNMLLELFSKIISESCFDILRTKEQLGYIVVSGVRRANGVQGLRFIIQSDKAPTYLDKRVENFLIIMQEKLATMEDEEFEKYKESLAVQRLEKPKKLSAECGRYWAEITSQQYNFERDSTEVAYLRTITKQQILEFYEKLIAHSAQRRHKLSVHVLPQNGEMSAVEATQADVLESTPEQNEKDASTTDNLITNLLPMTKILDVASFKSGLPLFPRLRAMTLMQEPSKSKL